VVTFGAFVEILPGVEGLVHISELAQRHVENPREVVSQGDVVPVLILEVDAERRRLSLSLKRVENGHQPPDTDEPMTGTPNLDLSEDVFADARSAPEAPPLEESPSPPAEDEPSFDDAPVSEAAVEPEAVEPEAVDVADEVEPAATDEAVEAEAPVSEER
jgi:small subunit ribosomal protein S1